LFPLDQVIKEQEQDLVVMRTGEMVREEEDRQRTGSEETYYTIKFPLYDNEQQAYAVGGIALDITERRQMEKALRESRERIGIALSAAQVCTWDWDIADNKIHWEGDVESVLGLAIDDLQTYESFLDLIHPDDRTSFNENVIYTLQEKEEFDAEFRIIRRDGKTCWMLGAGKVVFDDENRPVRMVGINKDVTERRNIKDKVRESEHRFRQMADHAPSFIWVSDQDGKVIYLNKAWYEFIGGSPETELGDGWLRHVHPHDMESLGKEFVVASEKRIAYSVEYRVRRRDGEYRWVMESGAPRYLENGEFLGYIGSCVDMTERKQIEAALEKSEALYRSVIQTQREMICRYTPDSTLTFVNNAFCATVGKTREQLIGRSLVEFLPRENHLKVLSMNVSCTIDPERIVLPNGEMRWHEWTDHPLYDHFGQVSEIQSVGSDVTDRVEADLEVNRMSTRLLLATHAANLGIWEWTVATDKSIWDNKMYEIFGLDSQLTGSPDDHWARCIHPDDRVTSQRAIENALNGGSDYEFEYRILKPGSGLRFLNSYGIVQRGPDSKPTAIIGVTWDNTERKLSEIALQQSEKRFRTLVQNLSVGIVVQNANFDIILANQAMLSLMGIPEVEMLSRTSADARWRLIREDGSPLPLEEQPATIALATDTMVKNKIVGVYREAFGDQIWLMVDAVPFRDKAGVVSQVTVTCIDITARVLAEKALRARGKQMKELTDRLTLATTAAHLGIFDFNPRTNELLWDNTMFEIFGKEKEIVSNVDTWLNAVHPDDRQAQLQNLQDAFRKEDLVYNTEFKIIREIDGAVRYIKALGTITRDAQHVALQMVGVNWDITEQKQKEEEIRNSEARYRSIVDGQREMICRYTRSGALTFANKSYLKAFGIISEDASSHSYLHLFTGSNSTLANTMMIGLFNGDAYPDPIEFQTDVLGQKRWLKWINIPLRNSDGEVYEVQAIGQDITERKQLEAQQARLDKIVRESYNEIYLFNADTLQFEFANASALDNLGYDISQLTLMKITNLFHYPNEMAMHILLKTLRTGETDRLQLQMKHRRKDGTYYDIETLIQVFEKDQSFVAIVTDITQKLVTEKKLLATIQEKEILIKEIHHRVKNNLQLISSIIYIKMASVKESEIQYFLGDMRQKIRSIALIHERLLQTENLDTVDIYDYLGKLVYDLQTSNSRQDLNLQITSSLEKKQMDLDTAIYCALIVNELITNAIKHAFRDLAIGVIEVSFHQDGNEYVLGVSDNGITMPDTIAPGESNSFGMHLLEIFVRQLGGKIEVRRHCGTSFIIRFPKKK
jgi:PAS domain S-box-containing protein